MATPLEWLLSQIVNVPDVIQQQASAVVGEQTDSTWIGKGYYDPNLKTLRLDLDGTWYTYYNVSEFTADRMLNGPHAGTYLNTDFKKHFHPFVIG